MDDARGSDNRSAFSSEHFTVLFSGHPLPMWIYDLETLAFLDVNSAAVARYGYSRDEFFAMRLTDIRAEEDVAQLLADARLERPAVRYSGEWRHKLRDGRLVDVEIASGTLQFGGRRAALVVVHDVTERKRAEAALAQSEARKAAVLDSVLDCIITMDADGMVIEFNAAAERTFGYTKAEAVGRPLAELIIPPRLREAHAAGLARYLATGKGPLLGKLIEITAVRSDGSEIPVELAITAIHSDRAPIFTGVLRDIASRKKADAELQRLNDEIQRQRLRVFKATIRTVQDIVNNLLSSLQLAHLEAEAQLPAEMVTLVDRMIQEAAVKLKTLGDLETVNEKEMGIGIGIDYPDSAS
jgi:PAS domain S-box-containing protein